MSITKLISGIDENDPNCSTGSDVASAVNALIDSRLLDSITSRIDKPTFYNTEPISGVTVSVSTTPLTGLSKLTRYVDSPSAFKAVNHLSVIDFFGLAILKTCTELPGAGNVADQGGTGSTQSYAQYGIVTRAQKVSFRLADNCNCNVIIDGHYIQYDNYTTPTNAGSPACINVEFQTEKEREIVLSLAYSGKGFSGVYTRPIDKFFPAKSKIKGCVFGDSFSVGTSSFDASILWPNALMQAFDLDLCVSGRGSTGFLATSNSTPSATTYNFLGRANDAVLSNAEIVFACSSINDANLDQPTVASNFLAWYNAIRAALPDAPIIVTGSPCRLTPSHLAGEQTIADAAATITDPNFFFVPVLTSSNPPVTGTGRISAQTGDGNADLCVDTDGTHFARYGHQLYSAWIVKEIARVLLNR